MRARIATLLMLVLLVASVVLSAVERRGQAQNYSQWQSARQAEALLTATLLKLMSAPEDQARSANWLLWRFNSDAPQPERAGADASMAHARRTACR